MIYSLIIVRFLFNIPQFGIIKDQDPTPNIQGKRRLGFPYGGMEPEDVTITTTASRELAEEMFSRNGVHVEFRKDAIIGEIPTGVNHTMVVLTVDVAPEYYSRIAPGKEQEAAFAVPGQKIDEYINDGIFLTDHAKAWQIYKSLFSSKLSQI
ncbi:MAG: hypothetical protein UW14_C0016G0017 [Candidatus Yanofskybacteria bacterium GW2011_GWA2_44_10]|nr:MAG: hypothetical protein UW14_C0016G0017 [Candidatus Yanofskybacteria bacterium GW2011_GWA2_44_10]